jgi:hypothetical protein
MDAAVGAPGGGQASRNAGRLQLRLHSLLDGGAYRLVLPSAKVRAAVPQPEHSALGRQGASSDARPRPRGRRRGRERDVPAAAEGPYNSRPSPR